MMYPFLTLDDQTEIVHSQLLDDGSVKVYVEKPDAKDCFHYATCFLPEYLWEDVFGPKRRSRSIRRSSHPHFRKNAWTNCSKGHNENCRRTRFFC